MPYKRTSWDSAYPSALMKGMSLLLSVDKIIGWSQGARHPSECLNDPRLLRSPKLSLAIFLLSVDRKIHFLVPVLRPDSEIAIIFDTIGETMFDFPCRYLHFEDGKIMEKK